MTLKTPRFVLVLAVLAVACFAVACADEIPETVSEQMEAARAAQDSGGNITIDVEDLLRAAPPGGYADWIRDIGTALDTVPALAAVDRGEALHIVQEQYSRRYEALRVFYGPDGAIDAGEDVAHATAVVGTRLQECMRLLAADLTTLEDIAHAVHDAREALTELDQAARQAGLAPSAPRDMVPPAT